MLADGFGFPAQRPESGRQRIARAADNERDILLAQRRASEDDKNGSLGEAAADASGVERCVDGMEVAERIERTWGLRFPIPAPQREEAAGPCRRSQAEDSTGVCEGWRYRSGLAHVSAHGRDNAGGDGRTSTHDPRLLASQQSPCDQQISSGNTGAEAPGARKISRCHLAGRFAVGEQINSDSVFGAEERILLSVRKNVRWTECFGG
jgi:hypothetical protein